MPFANFHAARLSDPDKFDDFRYTHGGTINGGKLKVPSTIDVVWGHAKGGPENAFVAQSLRFAKDKWSEADAQKWLKDNDLDSKTFEPAKEGGEKDEATTSASFVPLPGGMRQPKAIRRKTPRKAILRRPTAGRMGEMTLGEKVARVRSIQEGGPGSGNFGHAGRPGEIGGSGEGAGIDSSGGVKLGKANAPIGTPSKAAKTSAKDAEPDDYEMQLDAMDSWAKEQPTEVGQVNAYDDDADIQAAKVMKRQCKQMGLKMSYFTGGGDFMNAEIKGPGKGGKEKTVRFGAAFSEGLNDFLSSFDSALNSFGMEIQTPPGEWDDSGAMWAVNKRAGKSKAKGESARPIHRHMKDTNVAVDLTEQFFSLQQALSRAVLEEFGEGSWVVDFSDAEILFKLGDNSSGPKPAPYDEGEPMLKISYTVQEGEIVLGDEEPVAVVQRKVYEPIDTYEMVRLTDRQNQLKEGGPGSGNFGHAGRPGEIGGSSDAGGGSGKAGVQQAQKSFNKTEVWARKALAQRGNKKWKMVDVGRTHTGGVKRAIRLIPGGDLQKAADAYHAAKAAKRAARIAGHQKKVTALRTKNAAAAKTGDALAKQYGLTRKTPFGRIPKDTIPSQDRWRHGVPKSLSRSITKGINAGERGTNALLPGSGWKRGR